MGGNGTCALILGAPSAWITTAASFESLLQKHSLPQFRAKAACGNVSKKFSTPGYRQRGKNNE